MRGFESPPQFNPDKESNQPSSPAVEHAADKPTPSKMERVIEGAKDYLKHKSLKVKEYFGQLSQEDFDQLLDFDFKEQLRDNSPIDGTFSPEEELAKIRSLPSEQKREALNIFKEKLARQREGLATCRTFIERGIEFNHDISREKLVGLVDKFATQYGFNERQKQIAEQLIDGYFVNRQKVLEVRQQFPDDHALVGELTGVNIDKNEKIDVTVGPMTIDIDANGFNSGRLYERADKPVIGFKYGGFASQSRGENHVYYVVINKDKWISLVGYDGDLSGQRRRNHEHEHQKNKLFRAVFEHQEAPTELVDYVGEQDLETKRVILEDFFDASRDAALEKARDEITASLYDRNLQTLQSQLYYFFFSGKHDAYDYLRYLRNWEEFKNDTFYQETAQRMLVQEYRATIESAVNSYAELVNKGKYSTQEATALLTDKPLADWPKTVRRLLEQKE